MKIFRVVTEKDGIIKKMPGKIDTEIIQNNYRYAAETIQEVWAAIEHLLTNEDEIITAIIEEHPAVIVLNNNVD